MSREMGWPAFLLMETRSEGVFLVRFDDSLQVVGDTWHLNESDAKQQAEAEYRGLLGAWRSLPVDLSDEEIHAILNEADG